MWGGDYRHVKGIGTFYRECCVCERYLVSAWEKRRERRVSVCVGEGG